MEAAMTQDPHIAVDEHATSDERTYATLTHLAGLISFLDFGIMLGLIATLIMWQVKKNETEWLDDHLKEAMNFQIALLIWNIIAVVAAIVTFGAAAVVFIPFLIILRLVGSIRGAMYANKGRYYRYPASWRIIS